MRQVTRIFGRLLWAFSTTALSLSLFFTTSAAFAQNAATGALTGTVTDKSGSMVPDTKIEVTSETTGEKRTVASLASGRYVVPLLPPNVYRVTASKIGFKLWAATGVVVNVTEVETLDIQLQVGTMEITVEVKGAAQQLQTESSALGSVTDERMVSTLPLVTRNYTQILGLFPGVSAGVMDAGTLGRGGLGTLDARIVVHGSTAADNNFQMNGVEINDLQGSGGFSGGFAIPNPDAIQEFKVQTGQYDAAFGRNAGANVDVVTKSGANDFHGTLFEYFRNEALNANTFFLNKAGQEKPILRQNQYGFNFGGPFKKNKLLFFTSYQRTSQLNGGGGGSVAGSCSSNFSIPPFTNDRSAAAIGAMFAGRRGVLQDAFGGVGPAIAADGSNINPVALTLLNLKLPNGQFMIPTPQVIDPSQSFDVQGFSAFSIPCTFAENQFITNLDFLHTSKSKLSGRFFYAQSDQVLTLPRTDFGGPTAPGFPQPSTNSFRNFSLTHTYIFSPNLYNEAEIGFHRTRVDLVQDELFKFSDVGINAPPFDNDTPEIAISGGLTTGGNGEGDTVAQNTIVLQDSLTYIHGRHTFRFGGGVTRAQDNLTFRFEAGLIFLSWPDFLLGLDGAQNGTGSFSNVIASIDLPGQLDRAWRVWSGNAYVQDDLKISRRLTVNVGLRYERYGGLGETHGRNSNFYLSLANPDPPADGTLAGYVVSSNYTAGPIPAGVTKLNNNLGINGDGQNTLGPRLGFAWRLPRTDRMVLRGGYGIYYTRTTAQPLVQLLFAPPFGILRAVSGPDNAAATFQNPFPPAPPPLPFFPPYSPTTSVSGVFFSPTYRPSITQQYSMGLQTDLGHNLLLDVGYVGKRATELPRQRRFNQAGLASPANPIRGVTTNTLANIPQRVPIEGFSPSSAEIVETAGASWYNGLDVSLNKRFSNGLQFLASYTFARSLSTDDSSLTGGNGGITFGDQNNPRARYGPDNIVRDHRFVFSYLYELPGPKNRKSFFGQVVGGWEVGGVTTYQSGEHLTLSINNSTNVFGISSDHAQITGCTSNQLVTPGSIESKLQNYFNKSCFPNKGLPPIIGDDGKGRAFGNSGTGIVVGPPQANWDLTAIKRFAMPWPTENASLEFRSDFFNAFNHPQFANPHTSPDSANFGFIDNTSVNPRIIQFALKFNF